MMGWAAPTGSARPNPGPAHEKPCGKETRHESLDTEFSIITQSDHHSEAQPAYLVVARPI